MNKINDQTHAGKKTLRLIKQMKLLNPLRQDELVKNLVLWITRLDMDSMIQYTEHILASSAEPGIMKVCL